MKDIPTTLHLSTSFQRNLAYVPSIVSIQEYPVQSITYCVDSLEQSAKEKRTQAMEKRNEERDNLEIKVQHDISKHQEHMERNYHVTKEKLRMTQSILEGRELETRKLKKREFRELIAITSSIYADLEAKREAAIQAQEAIRKQELGWWLNFFREKRQEHLRSVD